MTYLLFIIFGLLPSIIWLLFFLEKDVHPEPKGMVLKIFFYGMIIALVAIFIELGFWKAILKLKFPPILISILSIFFGIALIEEVLKYLVVKIKVLSNPEFDEPVDAMLYMIISALGFVALENVLIFLSPEVFLLPLGETLVLASFRFISATFLHALCSGLVGYFLALSFFETKNRVKLVASGIGLATALHGIYNFSIIMIRGKLTFVIPVIILASLAFAVFLGFKKLEKMASVCKIDIR